MFILQQLRHEEEEIIAKKPLKGHSDLGAAIPLGSAGYTHQPEWPPGIGKKREPIGLLFTSRADFYTQPQQGIC